MENDVVRTSGEDAIVDLWLEGGFRAVTISGAAVKAYLNIAPEEAASVTEIERREFVRTHLGLISRAALNHIRKEPAANRIVIGPGELGRTGTLTAA